MNITELLKEDHREVESLIAQLEDGGDRETFGKLRNALRMHTQIEENILYPALENFDETEDLADQSYQDHDEVDGLLDDMGSTDPQSEEFQDLLSELKESIELHVQQEENQLFPRAENLLGIETLEEMGDVAEGMKTDSGMTRAMGM